MRKKIVVLCLFLSLFIAAADIKAEARASDIPKREFANVVLFAHFSGENAQADAAYFSNKENRDKIISYYNGSHGRSMTKYFDTVSYGKFGVHNIFPQDDGTKITSCQLSITEKEAQQNNVDSSVIKQLVENVPGVKNQVIDYDGDGYIDNLTVIMKGKALSGSSSVIPTLVSHKSDYPDSSTIFGGKRIGTYNMFSTGSVEDQQSGVIIHEFLHSLGYPDLYRGNIKDPQESCSHPVFVWDIMASASYRVPYPLCYTRMKYTNWLDIETVTESRNGLILDAQDRADGNQAYILKSPLNEHELFVAEFRKAGERYTADHQYNNDSLDAALLSDDNSGVIVYRVNTAVTGLSNYYGHTGIYVFRPQKGQNGYATNDDGTYNENMTVMNAALSDKNGRTSIGCEDMDGTLSDGALTFSDGTNSGIVIRNVRRNGDNQMSMDVSIPEASNFDLWEDTGFADSGAGDHDAGKSALVASCGGRQYLVTYHPMTFSSGKFQLYSYKNNSWSAQGSSIAVNGGLTDSKLFSHKNELYLAYITTEQKLCIKKCSGNGIWTDVLSIDNAYSDFDIAGTDEGIYLVYAADSSKAVFGKIENNKFAEAGTYFEKQYACGQPKLCALNGKIYAAVRDAAENNTIKVFRYDGRSTFTRIDNGSCSGGTYGFASLDGKLYISLGGSDLKMASYDGRSFKMGQSSGISSFEPDLSVVQGNLYISVSSASGDGNIKIFRYDPKYDKFIQEGMDVDGAGQSISITASENELLVSYVRKNDGRIMVKSRKTADDELLSLTIMPPKKTSYFQGDKVDISGIKVTANYAGGSRELEAGAYTITGFDTNTPGQRVATVKYGGKENTFNYEVMARQKPAAPAVSSKPKGTKITKLSGGKKKLTVKWKKQKSGITGYEIQYGLKKNFSEGTKKKTVSKAKTSAKISKLRSKKKYYVRIRTYKTVKAGGKTQKIYSGWSKTVGVKVK